MEGRFVQLLSRIHEAQRIQVPYHGPQILSYVEIRTSSPKFHCHSNCLSVLAGEYVSGLGIFRHVMNPIAPLDFLLHRF
jgi:hypothetical protein